MVGGGDAPGVNAILRAFAHGARRRGIEVMGCHYGFEGLLAPDGIVPLSIVETRGVLNRGGCFLGCSTRINPFFVETAGAAAPVDMGPDVARRLHALGVGALVMVGGDGTMLAAHRFTALGVPCVGVPKTIDNDLAGTALTCGFHTAVETATHAIDALHSTAEAHARVMVVEVMGRNSGALALHAGIGGGADVILLPEIPYSVERVVAKIREREALGLRFTIIVVSEGSRARGGDVLELEPGRPGKLPRLGGAGAHLTNVLSRMGLDHEVRLTVLGHLQRGGAPAPIDRIYGTQLGAFAAQLCDEERFGVMIARRGGRLETVPLDQAHNRLLAPDDPLIVTAREVGIELGG